MRERWPELIQRWKGVWGKYRYALLVLAAGVVLMLLPGSGGKVPDPSPDLAAQTEDFDLDAFEKKLAQALSQVEGAGQVQVVLTLDSGSRQVLAQDRKQEGAGAGSSTVVTVGRGSGTQEVVPLQTLAPSFRGALVVCPGGGAAPVRLRLTEAVSALTGLTSDKISICQGNP
ncbi:MAG: stage III sporulation protein AG [Lawsonibacter sp.]|nr:stage III sporulation protein AG [Lawsonibacter sp.]